jgi:RsiW-degrading membrane proteinase PrsW (M82 family)
MYDQQIAEMSKDYILLGIDKSTESLGITIKKTLADITHAIVFSIVALIILAIALIILIFIFVDHTSYKRMFLWLLIIFAILIIFSFLAVYHIGSSVSDGVERSVKIYRNFMSSEQIINIIKGTIEAYKNASD